MNFTREQVENLVVAILCGGNLPVSSHYWNEEKGKDFRVFVLSLMDEVGVMQVAHKLVTERSEKSERAFRILEADLVFSLRSGYLMDHFDEPLDAHGTLNDYGKRLIRAVLSRVTRLYESMGVRDTHLANASGPTLNPDIAPASERSGSRQEQRESAAAGGQASGGNSASAPLTDNALASGETGAQSDSHPEPAAQADADVDTAGPSRVDTAGPSTRPERQSTGPASAGATPLIVTRGDGIPVPDQAMGVELFKAQARLAALEGELAGKSDAYEALKAIQTVSLAALDERGHQLDAIARALDLPVHSWWIAGCDVMAHQITDLIANYRRAIKDLSSARGCLADLVALCKRQGMEVTMFDCAILDETQEGK